MSLGRLIEADKHIDVFIFFPYRYPGQEAENQARDTKIPTVLYYDEDGEVRAAGAEAVSDGIRMEAEDERWACAEW